MNYFRITAYHPNEDISVILDSNGRFEKLWEFSSFLVQKGFKIIEVSKEDAFEEGNLMKYKKSSKLLLRAAGSGKPLSQEHQNCLYITVGDYYYTLLK